MGTGDFRRRYERKNYNTDVVFSLDGKAFAGTLKDISIGGAYIMTLSAGQINSGDVIIISIPFTSGQKHI
jgi:hypothetical protein